MVKYELYIGRNIDMAVFMRHVRSAIALLSESYTITHGLGGWRGQEEPCTIVTLFLPSSIQLHTVQRVVEALAATLGEEAILLSCIPLATHLIKPKEFYDEWQL